MKLSNGQREVRSKGRLIEKHLSYSRFYVFREGIDIRVRKHSHVVQLLSANIGIVICIQGKHAGR